MVKQYVNHTKKSQKVKHFFKMIKKQQILELAYPKHFDSYLVWSGNIGVKVTAKREKIFVFKANTQHKDHFTVEPLGKFPEMTVESAIDLVNDKLKAPRLGSLNELINEYKTRKYKEGMRTINHVTEQLTKELTPVGLNRAANLISSFELSALIGAAINRGADVYANRLRSYFHSLFEFGIQYDLDPSNNDTPVTFKITQNPAAVIPRQKGVEQPRKRWLDKKELRYLLKKTKGTRLGMLIKICLYSGGQRPFEVINSRIEHINLATNDWFFPAQLTKNKQDHLIPITEPLSRLLREQASGEKYLFPSPKKLGIPISTNTFTQSIRRFCKKSKVTPFTPRDLRRTCKTMMSRYQIGTKEIRDRIHNHAINDVSSKHYDWYDYRKEKLTVLNKWAKFLKELE